MKLKLFTIITLPLAAYIVTPVGNYALLATNLVITAGLIAYVLTKK